MELRLKIGYNQVLDIVKQLPESQIQKLLFDTEKLLEKPKLATERSAFQKKLLSAPTMTDEQYKVFLETRKHFSKWRVL